MEYLAKKPFIVISVLTLFFIFLFDYVFGIENSLIRGSMAAFLAVILSPRKKKITTESGEKTQITWIFLKKPIIIN